MNSKELKQQHGSGHRALVGVERLRVDNSLRKEHAQQRHGAQDDAHEREQVGGVFVRRMYALPALDRYVDRKKRRDEHPCHNELVEHVGKIVCNLIRAGQRA